MGPKAVVLFNPYMFENQHCKPTRYMARTNISLGFLFFPDFKGLSQFL